MLRSKCRYGELGEKPTSWFLNQENRHHKDKVMKHLKDEDGEKVTNVKDILDVQKRYIGTLYKETIEVDDTSMEDTIYENLNKFNDVEAESLEGEITYEELGIA